MKKAFIMPLTLAMMAVCACTDGDSKKGAGLDMTDMDTSVAAQEDFYKYACGGWIKNNPLTAEYARFGSFDQLRLDTQEQLRDLVEGIAAQENEKGSVAQKIADVYSMKMDSTRRNELGAAPIQADLAAIDAISTREDLTRMVVSMNKEGVETFFGIYIGADAKNSSMNILDIYQGGTNMGDRDYYLEDDETTQEIQQAYREYIKKLFILAGCDEARAERAVESVMKIETGLARVQFSREEQRDPQKNYNKMTVKEFKARTSAFDWDVFFTEMGYDGEKELVVDQLPFIDGMDKVIKGASMDEIKDYLAFNLLDGATSLLSDDFEVASFEFYGKTLSGTEVQQPRWKRALGTVNGVLSEAVGQIYVEKYFPASSKERMVQLVKNLQVALGEHINALEWMGDSTKAKAQEKLSTFHVKIGYPDKWEDYSELEINPELSLYDNMKAVSAFFYQKNLDEKLGKPVDKDEWLMSPQTVNAYYNPTTNEICFPAAILQPPFFYPEGDDAINYGAIGVVIGHEMTHGFDDQGRQFDKDGNLNEWWTADDAAQFTSRADVLADQYSAIVVLDTVHANGRFTLGENIADQGGLRVAYTAFKAAEALNPYTENIDGFTPDQRFYLAYARLWAQNIRDAEILRLTKVDPHSLGVNRVNAAVKNLPTFYEAFDVKEGDAMYMAPEERVIIW
jgi:putative endopeptidase